MGTKQREYEDVKFCVIEQDGKEKIVFEKKLKEYKGAKVLKRFSEVREVDVKAKAKAEADADVEVEVEAKADDTDTDTDKGKGKGKQK